jgi:hypothetical protein
MSQGKLPDDVPRLRAYFATFAFALDPLCHAEDYLSHQPAYSSARGELKGPRTRMPRRITRRAATLLPVVPLWQQHHLQPTRQQPQARLRARRGVDVTGMTVASFGTLSGRGPGLHVPSARWCATRRLSCDTRGEFSVGNFPTGCGLRPSKRRNHGPFAGAFP